MTMRIAVMVTLISAAVAGNAVARDAVAGDAVARRTPAAHKPFLHPAEVLKRLEASPVQIKISGIEALQDVARGRLADETWKQVVQPVEYPKVRRKGGNVTLESWPRPKAVEATMEKAELAFQHKDYGEAATWYRKTLSIAPDFYIARAYLGDTHLFGGKGPRAAIAEYNQAIAANPDDYRLYFFRANAYRQLDDLQASLADLRRSLVLKPRNAILLGALQKARGAMGRAEPELFVPRGFVRREGDAISVYADIDRPEWLAWASCKALWMTDEEHRKDMLGTADYGWSTIEELECLGSLMTIYESRKASGEGQTDMRLERLREVIADGLTPAFVVYELGSRVDPQIVLRLDPRFREMMARYVEKYVLPPQ